MITDLMRNDLSRVCAPGSVAVTGLLEIQPHPGVWHLVSTVTGALAEGVSPADLLAATFPPGSVTGAPKSSAVRAIAAEEPHQRGAYTGAAGLITVDGRAELSVLIRTFEAIGRAGRARGRRRHHGGQRARPRVAGVPAQGRAARARRRQPAGRRPGRPARPGSSPSCSRRGCSRPSSPSTADRSGWPTTSRGWRARSGSCTAGTCPPTWSPGSPTWPGRRAALRGRRSACTSSRPGTGLDVSVTSRPLGPRLETCTLALATRSAVSWRHKWADRRELPGRRGADRTRPPLLPRPGRSGGRDQSRQPVRAGCRRCLADAARR